MEHVPPEAFGEDYLYFYEPMLTDELSDRQAEHIWTLLGLTAGAEVLDVPCGHGRISNRLAARGARVTGVDADALFLERARADAAARGVEVEYVLGDMRELPWRGQFEVVVNWFTSFGYFDDDENRRWLADARDTLKPGGRLLLDVHNRDAFARSWLPVTMADRDGDLLVDRHRFDVLTGRNETARFVVRKGDVRRADHSVRFFTFTELRDWLVDAGFERVEAVDHEGAPLTFESPRMRVIATR